MTLIKKIASDKIIDEAYDWLCRRRQDYHYNNDVWHLRLYWDQMKPVIQAKLLDGTYLFEPVKRIRTRDGCVHLWSSADALVLKAMAIVLSKDLRPALGNSCYHITDMGGSKGAVRAVQETIADYQFVFKSDVESYYASIDHSVLMNQVREFIKEKKVLRLICGYMAHLVDEDAELRLVERGIMYGCPLSPLMGAIYLKPLDDAMGKLDLFYIRYMDDWIVLASSRWKLRRAVKITNKILEQLKVKKHPFKTFFGRVAHGFDFLGYRLTLKSSEGLEVAWKSVSNHLEKIARLYEQGAGFKRIGQYLKGWWQWLRSGVKLAGGVGLDMEWYQKMVEGCFAKNSKSSSNISLLWQNSALSTARLPLW